MTTPSHAVRPDAISGAHAPRRRAGLHTTLVRDEAVLLDDRSGRLHHLNATAALVWQCLDGDVSIDELATEVAESFGQSAGAVRDGLAGLVRSFGHQGLLEDVTPDEDVAEALARSAAAAVPAGADPALPAGADVTPPRYLEEPESS